LLLPSIEHLRDDDKAQSDDEDVNIQHKKSLQKEKVGGDTGAEMPLNSLEVTPPQTKTVSQLSK
jgi:hypothetical protein